MLHRNLTINTKAYIYINLRSYPEDMQNVGIYTFLLCNKTCLVFKSILYNIYTYICTFYTCIYMYVYIYIHIYIQVYIY